MVVGSGNAMYLRITRGTPYLLNIVDKRTGWRHMVYTCLFYTSANGDFIEAEKHAIESKDNHNVAYVIKKGTSATNWITLKYATKKTYWMPSTSAIYYHLNPLNAKLKDIEWKFLAATPEYVATKATPAVVTPISVSYTHLLPKSYNFLAEYCSPYIPLPQMSVHMYRHNWHN